MGVVYAFSGDHTICVLSLEAGSWSCLRPHNLLWCCWIGIIGSSCSRIFSWVVVSGAELYANARAASWRAGHLADGLLD